MKAKCQIWSEAPEIGIPDQPALMSDAERLWLSYAIAPSSHVYAVVLFTGIIDHRLSPINDEGLGQHPYAAAGLQFYSFQEILGSEEAKSWELLGATHWVVTFKDVTLDVIARGVAVLAADLEAKNAKSALLEFLANENLDR